MNNVHYTNKIIQTSTLWADKNKIRNVKQHETNHKSQTLYRTIINYYTKSTTFIQAR